MQVANTIEHNPPPMRPWYRHRWPWLLMLGPAIVVVAGFYTLWLAVTTSDGLVADDYYKRGLAINQTLERVQRARDLGLAATLDIADDGAARVVLASRSLERAALPAAVRLKISHPTRAGDDVDVELLRGADGAYRGRLARLASGRWQITVETGEWRLPGVEITGAVRHMELRAEPGALPVDGSRGR